METIPLKYCSYVKADADNGMPGHLVLSSEAFCGSFPAKFIVESFKTGRKVEFVPVSMGDPLFDEDGWDGEAMVYRPVEYLKNVDHLVMIHTF